MGVLFTLFCLHFFSDPPHSAHNYLCPVNSINCLFSKSSSFVRLIFAGRVSRNYLYSNHTIVERKYEEWIWENKLTFWRYDARKEPMIVKKALILVAQGVVHVSAEVLDINLQLKMHDVSRYFNYFFSPDVSHRKGFEYYVKYTSFGFM